MAINYTWDVKTVDVKEIDGKADTVFNVHWRLNGEDEVQAKKDILDAQINELLNPVVQTKTIEG